MQDLVDRVSAKAGIQPEVASKAIGIILNFLRKEGPADEVEKVFEAIPGSREAASAAAEDAENGGSSGGFLGGLFGGGGGLMGLAGQLTSIGLGMGEMQTAGHEILSYARERVGEDTIGAIAGAIPGLSQFI